MKHTCPPADTLSKALRKKPLRFDVYPHQDGGWAYKLIATDGDVILTHHGAHWSRAEAERNAAADLTAKHLYLHDSDPVRRAEARGSWAETWRWLSYLAKLRPAFAILKTDAAAWRNSPNQTAQRARQRKREALREILTEVFFCSAPNHGNRWMIEQTHKLLRLAAGEELTNDEIENLIDEPEAEAAAEALIESGVLGNPLPTMKTMEGWFEGISIRDMVGSED